MVSSRATPNTLGNGTVHSALWDWRVPVAIADTALADGTLDVGDNGLAVANDADILFNESANGFDSALHYLVFFLDEALDEWASLTGIAATEVDIITHSTGGLVARSYIQSDIFGDAYTASGGGTLPTVNELIQVGVPNQGVGSTFVFLQNDFSLKAAARGAGQTINQAYELLKAGTPILDPDGTNHIVDATSLGGANPTDFGNADVQKAFVAAYVKAFLSLLADYAFIDLGSGFVELPSGDITTENVLLQDLNFVSPNDFVDAAGLGHVTIIHSGGVDTADLVVQQQGFVASLGIANEIVPFTNLLGGLPADTDAWYQLTDRPGDGTVSAFSSAGGFDNALASTTVINMGAIPHGDLVFDKFSQRKILEALTGILPAESVISTAIRGSTAQAAVRGIDFGLLDPVQALAELMLQAGDLVGDTETLFLSALDAKLPVLDRSLRELTNDPTAGLPLDLFDKLQNVLLTIGANTSLAELEQQIEEAILADGTGNDDPQIIVTRVGADLELRFDFDLSTASTVDVDLSDTAIPVDGDLTLTSVINFGFDVALRLDFAKLATPINGESRADVLGVVINDMNLNATLTADAINLTVPFAGLGDLTVTDGTALISAGLLVDVTAADNLIDYSTLLNGCGLHLIFFMIPD